MLINIQKEDGNSNINFTPYFDESGYLYLFNKDLDIVYQLEFMKNKPYFFEMSKDDFDKLYDIEIEPKKGKLIKHYGENKLTSKLEHDRLKEEHNKDVDITEEIEQELYNEYLLYYENNEYEVEYNDPDYVEGIMGDEDKIIKESYMIFGGVDDVKIINSEINDPVCYETQLIENNQVNFKSSIIYDTPHIRISLNSYGIIKYRNIGENEKECKLIFDDNKIIFSII